MEGYMPQSKTFEWSTPQELVNRYSKFDLDPCATKQNTKAPKFFTKEEDGLTKPWFGRVWVNPPYGREISKWVIKAMEEYELAEGNIKEIVMLLPSRTDTKWFHMLLEFGGAHIEFIKGRIKYGGSPNHAPFPSIIVTFKYSPNEV